MNTFPDESLSNSIQIKQCCASRGVRISGVAFAVGFQDLNYFGKCFKKVCGSSPGGEKFLVFWFWCLPCEDGGIGAWNGWGVNSWWSAIS